MQEYEWSKMEAVEAPDRNWWLRGTDADNGSTAPVAIGLSRLVAEDLARAYNAALAAAPAADQPRPPLRPCYWCSKWGPCSECARKWDTQPETWRSRCGVVQLLDGRWTAFYRTPLVDTATYLRSDGRWVPWEVWIDLLPDPKTYPTKDAALAALAKAPPPPGVT